MIVKEYYGTRKDGVNLFISYSNQNLCIQQEQTGNIYDKAIDVEDSPFTYIETDTPIEENEEGET